MSSYKLIYFDVPALGEPIRYLLSYGKVNFEDYRFPEEQWPTLKPNMPFGQVPVLEIDGKQLHQSTAICRYLGKKFGLAGATDCENLQIDMIADTLNDLRQKIALYHYNKDELKKEEYYPTLVKEILPYYMSRLEKIAEDNNGYLANKKLSWADILYVAPLAYINKMAKFDINEKYPNLQKVVKNVNDLPAVKAYLAKQK